MPDQAKTSLPNASSPELTGGAGFTFEDAVAAVYASALLSETTAPGLPARVVTRLSLQQGSMGHPLDDVIVEGRGADGNQLRLSLQVKRKLVISSALKNTDFRETILRAHATVAGKSFYAGLDRVGAAVGEIADGSKRDFETLCEWARSEADTTKLVEKLNAPGVAGDKRKQFSDVCAILADVVPGPDRNATAHQLLAHFVLMRFEMLHEGSTTEAQTVVSLANCLSAIDRPRADDLWRRLLALVRVSEGHAASFDRKTLVARLNGAFRLDGAPSLHSALSRVVEESKLAAAEIVNTIAGIEIPRERFLREACDALVNRKFVQIGGLPGTGKSVVLKALVERALANGPTLFLKADRLEGSSWAHYATGIGIGGCALEELLVELAATGSSTIYVDGVDRVELRNRGVLLDVFNTVLDSPLLKSWRMVVTVRDTGLEPIRTWLPARLFDNGTHLVAVEAFDDVEAKILATKKPVLKALLFGPQQIQDIARRPFFAAVLAKRFSADAKSPNTEIELATAWWNGGGYAAEAQSAGQRQNALVQLAQAGAAELGRRIPVLGIDPQALADLAADGIIREVRPGQTARFVHDIYFEWAFLQLLVSKHAQWIDMVRQIGEPPVLGRVIELLSQAELTYGEEWKTYLDQLEATTNIRTQWLRAWMLGPFGLIGIGAQEQIYDEAMFADNAKRVAKLAVWFQAEKTKANPIAFDTARFPKLTLGQRLFYADFLAFPSDFEAWRRFCNWLVKHIARIPASTRSDVLAVFEVWQNAFADFPNDVSHAIVRLVHDWLADIEGRENTGSLPRDRGDWDALKSGEREDIESRCRALLLRAGRAYPSLVLEYLSSLRALERMPRSAFKEVMVFSLVLSEECPAGLVELALHSLLEPLPEEIARRASKLPYGSSFSSHDWRSLSVEDNYEFFPSAPTREPFKALFSQEPNEARRLVRQLTNHAIESWRQLHNFHYEGRGNPIPLTLNFPWGEQTFWGASQEYLWSRGTWGPHAVSSGLMALEVWALSQIDEGRAVDDILREVLEGQDAVGALGVAVAIVLERQHCSEVSLPLITSQRLWDWDIQRRMSDLGQSSNLIGFKPGEELHQAAVVAGNKLVSRKTELRSMASICVLRGGELGERASAAIVAFPKSLPFNYEEEKEHADHVSNLKRTAEIWAEVGKKENYRATPAENGSKVLIEMNNPKAQGSDFDAINRRQAEMEAHYRLINWVNHFFETKSIDEKLPLEKAVVAAKQLETKTLFDRAYSHSSSDYLKQAAVAGVASVVLNQAAESSDDFEWAAKVCTRAGTTPEALDELFFSGSILVHHPVALSIPGLSAMLRHDKTRRDAQLALTALAAHYYEQIVVESIGAMLSVWDSHPDIAWNALDLAISLSIFDRPSFDAPPDERDAEARRKIDATVQKSLDRTNEPNFSTTALPALPPAWVQSPDGPRLMRGRRGRNVVVEWEHSSQAVHTNLLAKVLAHIPIDVVMADAIRRELFLAWFDGLVNWTIERVSPSWSRTTGQERFEANSSELFEWRRILFRFCARLALHLELEDGARRYIEPANACDDETFSSLMVSFVETLACRFMDEVEPLPQAIALLMRVVPRMVISGSWKRAAWNEGTLTDTELSRMVQAVFFVDVEKAIGAARFANGDWTDIRSVLPLTDALVKEHGQTPTVASAFLTRCERAFTAYPLGEFVSQLPLVLGQDGMPPGWRESRLPARLAGLIQRFSEKTQPLPVSIARSLLAALDMLVDMGDRRAAAVQTSEVFKGIRTA